MACVSKSKLLRRAAGLKGGRGRRHGFKHSKSAFNTPLKPKTTAWRHKSKAAAAEKALHKAAYNSIKLRISKCGSPTVSRPSTGCQSDEATAGSLASNRKEISDVAANRDLCSEFQALHVDVVLVAELDRDTSSSLHMGSDEDFVDIDENELNPRPMDQMDKNSLNREYSLAVKCWPHVSSLKIKLQILKQGISDLEKVLNSMRYPTGHDFQWHLQVLYFMNSQLTGILNQQKGAKEGTIKMKVIPPRIVYAMNIAIAFRKGCVVQERILKHQKKWLQERKIPASRQGKNAKMVSMLEDEGTMAVVQECIAGAGAGLRASTISNAVTAYWLSSQSNIDRHKQLQLFSTSLTEVELHTSSKKLSLSARAASQWLHRMGFDWKEVKKGVYKDGHERPDVLDYRQSVFLPTLEGLQPRMPYPILNDSGEVIEIELPYLAPGDKLCIPITHDECTCNANDGPHHQWIKGDENPIRKKSRGQGLHISEFISPWGRLSISPEDVSDTELVLLGLDKRNATEIIQCGGDIWWNQEHIVQQTLTAITVFEAAYPDCQALFLFDNATSHSAYAEDVLRSNRTNKACGGKQPQMRDGFYQTGGESITIVQQMSFGYGEEVSSELRGKPKGLQLVLEERGLWPEAGLYLDCTSRSTIPKDLRKHSLTNSGCCARKLLSEQLDFKAQKGRVQEVVEARGHLVLFYPRFHCELNWIEYFWARVKLYTRTNCGYDIKSLQENVPAALDWASSLIPKWWGKTWRIMGAYREGITYGTEEFKTRAYKSHRRVTVRSVNTI